MEQHGAAFIVTQSIVQNPGRANVLVEARSVLLFGRIFSRALKNGNSPPPPHFRVPCVRTCSLFLQNMMVASPRTTAQSIFSLRANSDIPAVLPTLLAAGRTTPADAELVAAVCGLLTNAVLDVRGAAVLRGLETEALAVNAIRDHPDSPRLHALAFALWRWNAANAGGKRVRGPRPGVADLVLRSMETHPEEATLQIEGCRLLAELAPVPRSFVGSGTGRDVLMSASEKFPDDCKDVVDGLLCA